MRTAAMTLFVLAISSFGCATPAPLVRLNPKANDIVWVAGRASVRREAAGVRVASAFESQDGRNLGLRVEIENDTGAPLEVGPQDLTFTTCVDETVASCAPTQRVIDPEQVLANLDVAESRGVADAENGQAYLGTMVLLGAVGDAASVASGDAHASTGPNAVAAVIDGDSAAREDVHQTIAYRRQLWSDQALRRTTLEPGQGTGGLVFLPTDLRAGYVWLHAKVAGSLFHFRFEQVVTQVAPLLPASSLPEPYP